MKALVTGSSGFVGSHLARHLAKAGHTVITPPDPFQNITTADLKGVDVIFHQAAITNPQDKNAKRMNRVNHLDAVKLFRIAIDQGVRRIVYASSAAVYGSSPAPFRESQVVKPLTPYAKSKADLDVAAENLSANTGVPIIGLRYSNVFGLGEESKGKSASVVFQLFQQMKAGKHPKLFQFGEQLRDWVYVEDVCRANVLAANSCKYGEFNIGSGQAISFNDVVKTINVILCTDLEPEYIPNPFKGSYQSHTEHDLTKAASELGYRPQNDLFDGVLDMVCKT